MGPAGATALLNQLLAGDVVMVWKLDRISRSLLDTLRVMLRINEAGASFKSLTETIDTTTPGGLAMMQMRGVIAELECRLIRERRSPASRKLDKPAGSAADLRG
jgi:DNA invertase Pin-like site-specific DNA recombinase